MTTGVTLRIGSSIWSAGVAASRPPPQSHTSPPDSALSARTRPTGSPETTSTAGSGVSSKDVDTTIWRRCGQGLVTPSAPPTSQVARPMEATAPTLDPE